MHVRIVGNGLPRSSNSPPDKPATRRWRSFSSTICPERPSYSPIVPMTPTGFARSSRTSNASLHPARGQLYRARPLLEANIQEAQPHRTINRKTQAVQAHLHTIRPHRRELPCHGKARCPYGFGSDIMSPQSRERNCSPTDSPTASRRTQRLHASFCDLKSEYHIVRSTRAIRSVIGKVGGQISKGISGVIQAI